MSMMIHNKKQRETPSIIRRVSVLSLLLMTTVLSACSTPMTAQNLCELKVLSLLIPKQSEEAVESGSLESIQVLKRSQEKLNQTMDLIQKNDSNHQDLSQMLANSQAISKNIDVIAKNQDNLNRLYDYQIVVFEQIPSIQAEYNLLTDMMARKNYPATQVVIAKNQVFMGERILRSIGSLSKSNEFSRHSMDDFLADLETFNVYLHAQLNGNAELGVERVKDTEMRESLLSIQEDIQVILDSETFKLLQKREPLASTYQAARDNVEISDEIFIKLNQLERNTAH